MNDDKKFLEWMEEVDDVLVFETGLGSADLPDWCWRDAYTDGLPARSAAWAYLEEHLDD